MSECQTDIHGFEVHVKRFEELTTTELYALLHARIQVFAIEQNIVYNDLDYDDQNALHLWLTVDGKIVALSRIFPAGLHLSEASIGRVLTTVRGKGYGRQVMLSSIKAAKDYFGATQIDIEAQEYARGFYEGLGFRQISDVFMIDGIRHIRMALTNI